MSEIAPAADLRNFTRPAVAERPGNFATLLAWTAGAGVILVKL
jgi:hypothetical protein